MQRKQQGVNPKTPKILAELGLCILQDQEFLSLCPWITNHMYSVVVHLQLTRRDSEHGLCENGVGCCGAKV